MTLLLPLRPDLLPQLLTALAELVRQLRLAATAVLARPRPATAGYETLWLSLVLELRDAAGERAVLTRRQRVRFLGDGEALIRELLWGEGDQLVRYRARGARRIGVRAEGSKRALLLDPEQRPTAGDQLTLESRRGIHGGFRGQSEYCEVFLERPTGRLDVTVVFPPGRPPRAARLVRGPNETLVRRVPVRYRADGRAALRCRLRRPTLGTTYSLRWSW